MADVPPGVKGMNDILAPEVSKWQFLEQQARDVLEWLWPALREDQEGGVRVRWLVPE